MVTVSAKLAFLLVGLALGFFVLPMLQGMFSTAPAEGS
jgi:hypothetical protein